MKKLFLIISLLSAFYVNDADAACTGSSPTWSCTANSTSAQIQSCINSASPGDTINVGTGSGTWSGISITKGVLLIGAGIGSTVITLTGSIDYNPANYNLNSPFRISGFSFNMNNRSSGHGIHLGANNKNAPFTVQTNLRIDHNRFYGKNVSTQTSYIYDQLIANGVIDHNTFDSCNELCIRHIGGADAEHGWWTTSPQNIWTPGTGVGMYVENNTFDLTTSISAVDLCDTTDSGGKYIYRYNRIISNKESQPLFDIHGNQSASNGSFGAEVYGNRMEFSGSGGNIFKTRGGSSFVFYNSVVGGGSNIAYVGAFDGCPSAQYHPNYRWYTILISGAAETNTAGALLDTDQSR